MSKRKSALSFVGELGLWGLANTLCLAIVGGTLYGVGGVMLGWNPLKLSIIMTIGLLLTATWGSWATLIWTKNRGLRAVQQAMTMSPGVITLALGGVLLYLGFGTWYIAALVIAAGLGMSMSAVVLAGGVFTKNSVPSKLQYLLGVALFPLMCTVLAGLVAFAWLSFVPTPLWNNLQSFFSLATAMTFIMASTLISTMIPALCSRACQELSIAWSIKSR